MNIGTSKEILVMGDKSMSLITRSVIKHLTEMHVNVTNVGIRSEEIKAVTNLPGLIMIQADNFTEYNSGVLTTLRELCIKNQRNLIILGQPEEIESVCAVLSPTIIGATFTRPFDVREVAGRIVELLQRNIEKHCRRRILIVDDSPVVLRSVMGLLTDSYKVILANSADNAFTRIAESRPDAILLDYEMPGCNGAECLERLRSNPDTAGIPVLFLTSKCDPATVNLLLGLKPAGYLLKDTPRDLIIDKIESALSSVVNVEGAV